jgi:hypothetical protein
MGTKIASISAAIGTSITKLLYTELDYFESSGGFIWNFGKYVLLTSCYRCTNICPRSVFLPKVAVNKRKSDRL